MEKITARHMQDEIQKIGELLRIKREEMHLSVKEVENSTSIRSNYLKAIEEGRIDHFLSSIYVLGFIRQYALFLGLDVEKLVKDYPKAFTPPTESHDFSYGIGTIEMRKEMRGGVKWFPNLFWVSISVGILALAWYLARYLDII